MLLTVLKSKLHRVKVTDANINYIGSITIDGNWMDAAGIIDGEQVHVVDVTNGARIITYAIRGKRGSKEICLNGAAARLVSVGDTVIIIA
ncbi:MAG TPA: aspartate 1-decarboxylase, partial [Bacteroidaceae bacterium]|nr:aspartate 1-decarboxylase [Bacteroidaceae bacterium]